MAIALPDPIKNTLTALCGGVDGARWRERRQLHLTLRFIGEVDGAMARDIDDVLHQIRMPAFSLTLRRTGFFNERKLARVLWAGVENDKPLRKLRGKIQHGLGAIGLEPEHRRYHPHVTLARLDGIDPMEAEGYAARYSEYTSPPFMVDRFCLFSSHLARQGAIYTVESEYALDQPSVSSIAAIAASENPK
ncbi:MAG: RNA 2',3'-cyclic phosphodiesterase [Rhodospirillaceae bacterium]|nr:RNA 2',3'-cyclic phosphodiesterase [Rhodospirillaceae bacterium]